MASHIAIILYFLCVPIVSGSYLAHIIVYLVYLQLAIMISHHRRKCGKQLGILSDGIPSCLTYISPTAELKINNIIMSNEKCQAGSLLFFLAGKTVNTNVDSMFVFTVLPVR